MKEKYLRNIRLFIKWETENYSIRGLAKMFKISHVRALQIIKKHRKEINEFEEERKKRGIKEYGHSKINKALKKGEIKRKEICEDCEEEIITVAHHENYLKPLKVIWLCRSCHQQRHVKIRQKALVAPF